MSKQNISRIFSDLLWRYRAKESAIENNKIQKRMEKRQSFLFRKPDLSTQEIFLNYISDVLGSETPTDATHAISKSKQKLQNHIFTESGPTILKIRPNKKKVLVPGCNFPIDLREFLIFRCVESTAVTWLIWYLIS